MEEHNFVASLEHDFVPTIPDELTQYYLQRSGFVCPDIRISRLIGLAAQKFLTEIATDAFQIANTRQSHLEEKDLTLTIEDLAQSLQEYGIQIKKPAYFADKNA